LLGGSLFICCFLAHSVVDLAGSHEAWFSWRSRVVCNLSTFSLFFFSVFCDSGFRVLPGISVFVYTIMAGFDLVEILGMLTWASYSSVRRYIVVF